jgi:hypothetical protein
MPRRSDLEKAHRLRDSQLYAGFRQREQRRALRKRRRQSSSDIKVTQPSVMQSRLDNIASIVGLAGIIGGLSLVALDNQTGWIAVATGAVMEAAAISQMLNSELASYRNRRFRSSRLALTDYNYTRNQGQQSLPMPDPTAPYDFFSGPNSSEDNSEF